MKFRCSKFILEGESYFWQQVTFKTPFQQMASAITFSISYLSSTMRDSGCIFFSQREAYYKMHQKLSNLSIMRMTLKTWEDCSKVKVSSQGKKGSIKGRIKPQCLPRKRINQLCAKTGILKFKGHQRITGLHIRIILKNAIFHQYFFWQSFLAILSFSNENQKKVL